MLIISVTCGSVDGFTQYMNVYLEPRQNLSGTKTRLSNVHSLFM